MKLPKLDLRLTLPLLVAGWVIAGCDEFGEHVDEVTGYELTGILNYGGFPTNQACQVVHSYYSQDPPPNNDYFKAYAIHLAPFPEALLATNRDGIKRWESGGDTDEIHRKVLEAAQTQSTSTTKVGWLPPPDTFTGTNFYRYFACVNLRNGEPNPADFFAYDRQKQMLYFVGFKH